ncbi:MAG: NUDIX hydrolase [Candidatus Omnitrophica bacterium]|nr:NUDIX hydrolase [Candidatus Omnitrophota bacterium]
MRKPTAVTTRRVVYQSRRIALVLTPVRAGSHAWVHETVRHPGSAVILPLLDSEHLVMVRQYRRTVRRTLWELPAGTLDGGESPLHCARRELEEEVGFQARRWRRLHQFYPAPGLLTERMTLFLATDLVKTRQRLMEDERLEARVVRTAQAWSWARQGTIIDGKTLLGLYWWRQHRWAGRLLRA